MTFEYADLTRFDVLGQVEVQQRDIGKGGRWAAFAASIISGLASNTTSMLSVFETMAVPRHCRIPSRL